MLLSMTQVNFKKILAIKKQYPDIIDLYSQDYQNELLALFKVIEQDSFLIQKGRCCQCFHHLYFKLTHKRDNKLKLINIQLYNLLQFMTIHQRIDFVIQFFQCLKAVFMIHEKIQQKEFIGKHYEYKKKLLKTVLKESGQFLQDNSREIKQLKKFLTHNNDDQQFPLHLQIDIDQITFNKIAIFQQFKMILIQQVDLSPIIRLDLRNYYFIDQKQSQKHHFTLVAFEKIIMPSRMSIRIDEKQILIVQKYTKFIKWISIVGIFQRLVNIIDVSRILGKQTQNINKMDNNLFKTVLGASQDGFYQNIENDEIKNQNFQYIDSLDLLIKVISWGKKDNKAQTNIFEKKKFALQKKKLLIQILNSLAEQKEKQNKKIQQFLTKQSKIIIKPNYEGISNLINNKQSIILPKQHVINKHNTIIISQMPRLFLQQQSPLKIIDQHSDYNANHLRSKDSFYSDRNKQSQFYKKFYGNHQKRKFSQRKYKKSIYYKMYPNEQYKISSIQNLGKFQQVVPYQKMYLLQQKVIKQQFEYLKLLYRGNYDKFQQRWIQKIKQIKIFLRLDRFIFKVFIPTQIPQNALTEALIDIPSYSRWHPNIKESYIESVIDSQNSLIFSMTTQNLRTKKISKSKYLLHLFQIQSKYYIALKYLPPQTPHKIFSLFSFTKQSYSPPQIKIDFFLIRISKDYGGRASQLNFIIQYQNHKNIKLTQEYQFFINFFFIKNYWQKEQKINDGKQKQAQKNIINSNDEKKQVNPSQRRLSIRPINKNKCILNLNWPVKYDFNQQTISEEQAIQIQQDEFDREQLQQIASSFQLSKQAEYYDL